MCRPRRSRYAVGLHRYTTEGCCLLSSKQSIATSWMRLCRTDVLHKLQGMRLSGMHSVFVFAGERPVLRPGKTSVEQMTATCRDRTQRMACL
jgi:hypothetical protein